MRARGRKESSILLQQAVIDADSNDPGAEKQHV